jgi:DNA-directed RNA polymerase specialized sigma24 family protein
MQAAFLVLLQMAADLPEAEPELLALVTVVTKRRLVDFFRHRAVREGRDAGLEDIEEAPVSDGSISLETRADWDKMLALIDEEIAEGNVPPEALRWARGLAEGKTIAEMAAEDGVSESKIKMVLKRAREALGPRWKERLAVGSSIVVAFLVFLFFPRGEPTHHGRGHDRDMGAPKMPTSSAPAEPDAGLLTADELRATARDACNAQQWARCQQDLNRAAELDPESEKRPDVIALRNAIDQAIRSRRLKP